tara:strand:- start:353 stop:607 length:255 start_codon:yes stop_codon:yes gene_type:complete
MSNENDEKNAEYEEQVSVLDLQAAMQEANTMDTTSIRLQVVAIAKDVLERNAALQWEQDKTRGLTITVDEIINEAQKLLDFVMD